METFTPSQDESRARSRNVENIICGPTRVTPNLPVELHKLIVDELEGEKKALKQCALTCRLYRHFAQKLLFKKVVFRFSCSLDLDSSSAEFLDIIRASPQIVNYVQQFRLHLNVPPEPHRIAEDLRARSMTPEIFRILTNVVDLVLNWERRPHSFSAMDSSTRLAIMDKCECLLNLTVRHTYDVPLKIFDHLHRLERLTLGDVIFVNKPDAQVAQTAPYRIKHMNLGAIEARGVATLFPFLVSKGIGMGTLESLAIHITHAGGGALPLTDFQAAKSLIRSSAGSLKVLDVRISSPVPSILPDAEPLFHLSEMPLLEEWSLEGGVCYSEIAQGTSSPVGLGWLSRQLETIPSGRKFKRITLHPSITKKNDKLDFESFKYFERLVVDKVLSHTESFSVHFPIWEDELSSKWRIQTHLRILNRLHLLHFRRHR
ncbi:hypothetical protein CPC08DRAFT_763292 [Agrocybe pediades]|nr:hypothetical protein CPC08DRAFT_763292 [Agrocybe pediades]